MLKDHDMQTNLCHIHAITIMHYLRSIYIFYRMNIELPTSHAFCTTCLKYSYDFFCYVINHFGHIWSHLSKNIFLKHVTNVTPCWCPPPNHPTNHTSLTPPCVIPYAKGNLSLLNPAFHYSCGRVENSDWFRAIFSDHLIY